MRRPLYLLSVLLFLGIFAVHFMVYQAYAHDHDNHHPKPTPKPTPRPTPKPSACTEVKNQLAACNGNLDTCNTNLGTCGADLDTCNADLAQALANLGVCTTDLDTCTNDLADCESQPSLAFPGDGYSDPDAFGVSGHSPALSYTDNLDGTFTDNNTGLMWEIKDDAGGIHDKDNVYFWTDTADLDYTNPDGTMFTVFLDTLNNKCDGDETTSCTTDADCTGIGNGLCGLAGHRDWRIPNVKELQSIVDYSKSPATSIPGFTQPIFFYYLSATSYVPNPVPTAVWGVDFGDGRVLPDIDKGDGGWARAVRP